ncbi:MAG: hypothetical protein DHS20C02_07020 [Micavibrio sp.]|nr:MAG: hypothetical protein DHS20C02_07020 [Micavibrio sp.]
MNQRPPEQVEIIHRINRIKKKVAPGGNIEAPGFINPEHIKNAQSVVEKSEDTYKEAIASTLEKLREEWEAVKTSKSGKNTDEIHRLSNHIMDMASTYKYELMDYFGHSLRDISAKIDVKNKAHQTIVQAHIDVMLVAYAQNIKGQGGATAKELKLILAKAIDKHELENTDD